MIAYVSGKLAEKKLSSLLNETQEKNVQLEQTKKAMLNVLEDVEEEREKTSLERDKINTILQGIGGTSE